MMLREKATPEIVAEMGGLRKESLSYGIIQKYLKKEPSLVDRLAIEKLPASFKSFKILSLRSFAHRWSIFSCRYLFVELVI